MTGDRLQALLNLKGRIQGELLTANSDRIQYATDASAYREVPLGILLPKSASDIVETVRFALEYGIPLIPRAAGTSLAGQVVGAGLIVDVSRHMNRILEVNANERWVRVEPGVVLDELNQHLKTYGLFFGPETSTSNRCMMGGMLGNNACGAHSIIYGSTRDHTLSVKAVLSDGQIVEFSELSEAQFEYKCLGSGLEADLYRNIREILSDPKNVVEIREQYPDPAIRRRNTGYAIDIMLENQPFNPSGKPFNFCRLLAGSEGTLAFTTEIKLNLVPLPPQEKALVCAHFTTLEEALEGNLVALAHKPGAVELMDKFILDCTRDNIVQRRNRFFIEGDPGAILIIEFARNSKEELHSDVDNLIKDLQDSGLGYHFPIVTGSDIPRVWALRKAGLGVLSNIPGDAKPVSVIEDTAVNPSNLPAYISEFKQILARYGLEAVYHAHIATGELHLRPVLNLKDPSQVEVFRSLARDIALLVKKFKGSLSGEHGDGRLRGEFIPLMVGDKNYSLLKSLKKTWDPAGIFNPGKITDTPVMNTSLRYQPGRQEPEIETFFDFSDDGGILRAAERCNGSGDCRKSHRMGGTMCPSYMASREENTTTRARANILREYLTHSEKKNRFDHREIYEVMDLCLSCKGCKSECPSNVDMARYKAEFLQHYYDEHGIPLRALAISNISRLNRLGSLMPWAYNFMLTNRVLSAPVKKIMGIAENRSLPPICKTTLRRWLKNHPQSVAKVENVKAVYLFIDEFTNYNDAPVGIAAVELLNRLGYRVMTANHEESGRASLSKGLVRKAKALAMTNILIFKDLISDETPLVGIEPSAILSFRDEYPDLAGTGLKAEALKLAAHCLTFEEFFMREVEKGRIGKDQFTNSSLSIKLHGHCHQKAIAGIGAVREMLSFPENYRVEEIPSGCCGMAGSFGYEKEHYDLSMKVGELVLFPAVREASEGSVIAAPGTSCRHQILDGTGKRAFHPVEVMRAALRS
jgi:FAD/FMN-containing dehydrogenase/Fe-S oxidoreductase